MGYIGQPLNAGNLSQQAITGDGTTTPGTLDYSVGSSQSIAVFYNGVAQIAGTDFSASGTVLTLTTAQPSSVIIHVIFLALPISLPVPGDNTVTTAKVTDDAITLAKMAGGTDGNIISYDASGDPVAVATGSSGQVLTSAGAGAPPTFAAAAGGGAWNLIGTQEASSDATLTQTGLSSTYDVYKIFLSTFVPTTDGTGLFLFFGDSAGIDESGNDYNYHFQNINTNSGTYGAGNSLTDAYMKIAGNVGSSAGEGAGCEITIFCPSDGGLYATYFNNTAYTNATNTVQGGSGWGGRVSIITLDRVRVNFAAGNIESGRMSVYGLSHA